MTSSPTARRISIAEPVTETSKIPIIECGEPLVDFIEFCPDLAFGAPRFDYRREKLVRKSVAEMLCAANAALPKGLKLAIGEGWRPPHIQHRMYMTAWSRFKEAHPDWSQVKLRRVVNRYVAPVNSKAPTPHSSGGAVDLNLVTTDGVALDHHSPFKRRDPQGYSFYAPGLTAAARETRDILASVLLPTGMTNYPSEFWHWTYGDQGWAYRGGHPNAIYGPIVPPNYEPDPRDVRDEPLVWIFQEE